MSVAHSESSACLLLGLLVRVSLRENSRSKAPFHC